MKRYAPLTLIAVTALILAGCADGGPSEETQEAIATTRYILEEDCEMDGAVNNCTDWLTGVVSSSYDVYETIEEPTDELTSHYDSLNDMSGEYARDLECPDTDRLDPDCVAQHLAIKNTAEMLIHEAEQL